MSETVSNDYVSMINKKGSGYNIPVIVDAIVDAAIAPLKTAVTARKDIVDAAVSGMGTLKSSMQISQKNVATVMSKTPHSLKVTDNSNYTSASITDGSKITSAAHVIENAVIARPMVFAFYEFSSATVAIDGRTISVNIGNYASEKLAEVSSSDFVADSAIATVNVTIVDQTPLNQVVAQLNAVAGITAELLKISDTSTKYSVIVRSESTGLNNSFKLASSGTRFDTDPTSDNAFKQLGKDASLRINGLLVTRESNTISDLVPGLQINLLSDRAAQQTITTALSSSNIQSNVESLIAELNAYKGDLDKLGFLDEVGEENGELVNNAFLRSAQQKLMKLIASPIKGFGDDNIYFVEFGIKTAKDGSYVFDKKTFDRTLLRNPEKFNALTQDKAYASNSGIFVFSTSDSSLPQGKHTFKDGSPDVLNVGTAAAKNLTMTGSGPFTFSTTDYPGFLIQSNSNAPGDFDIYVGRSAKTMLTNFFNDALATTSNHDATVQRYTDKSANLDKKLARLDQRELLLQNRYTAQFSAMEKSVNMATSSEDFLTQMVDGWNKS